MNKRDMYNAINLISKTLYNDYSPNDLKLTVKKYYEFFEILNKVSDAFEPKIEWELINNE